MEKQVAYEKWPWKSRTGQVEWLFFN